jgi:cobaltochelatase CobS
MVWCGRTTLRVPKNVKCVSDGEIVIHTAYLPPGTVLTSTDIESIIDKGLKMATPKTAGSSAVVDALKAAALEKIRGTKTVADARPDMKVGVDILKAAMPEPTPVVKWPTVLDYDGATRMFSEVFPEYVGRGPSLVDFPIPDYSGYEFPEWMKAYIPASSDYRADPVLLHDAVMAYACGSVTHCVGWPGTGKSNGLPVLIAHRLGLPLLRLGLNKKGMMLDDLIGREAIKSGDSGLHTGHRDGVLVPWVEHPTIILADEFCRANTEISNGLMSLMERGGCLIIENRNPPIVKRHVGCWILASDNAKGLGDQASRMVGTDVIDGAVLDRFEVTLEVDYLPPADQEELVRGWFPGFPEAELKALVKFGTLIQQGYKKETLPLSFSPRSLKEVARYACIHQDVRAAVRKVVVAKYAEESDVSAVREMFRTAFGKEL